MEQYTKKWIKFIIVWTIIITSIYYIYNNIDKTSAIEKTPIVHKQIFGMNERDDISNMSDVINNSKYRKIINTNKTDKTEAIKRM